MRSFWLSIALLVAYTMQTTAIADDLPAPQALVKNASDSMLQALKDNKAALEEDPTKIHGLIQDILMPIFDFNAMSKLALGKNWRQANEMQREEFIQEFRLLLVRTYSTAMLEYTDEEIKLLPFEGDLSSRKARIAMEVIQASGPSIPMDLSMYQNKAGEWKVYDVKIDGISLVTNYRSTFNDQIRDEGMDKMIESLASRNEKVKV
jgi:phospholipid transport system substrate-binding protein